MSSLILLFPVGRNLEHDCPLGRFYIGCERCSDWFHGRCVGILQIEAEKIDEYLCPNCAPESEFNQINRKILNDEDYELVKKLAKQIIVSLSPLTLPRMQFTCFYLHREIATVGRSKNQWIAAMYQTTTRSLKSQWVSPPQP